MDVTGCNKTMTRNKRCAHKEDKQGGPALAHANKFEHLQKHLSDLQKHLSETVSIAYG